MFTIVSSVNQVANKQKARFVIIIIKNIERTHAKMQPDINSKVKTERGGRHDADAARVLCLPFSFKCKYI